MTMSSKVKTDQAETHFCEVKVKQERQPGRAVVRIEPDNISIEVRNADTGAIQEYLLDVLAGSC